MYEIQRSYHCVSCLTRRGGLSTQSCDIWGLNANHATCTSDTPTIITGAVTNSYKYLPLCWSALRAAHPAIAPRRLSRRVELQAVMAVPPPPARGVLALVVAAALRVATRAGKSHQGEHPVQRVVQASSPTRPAQARSRSLRTSAHCQSVLSVLVRHRSPQWRCNACVT